MIGKGSIRLMIYGAGIALLALTLLHQAALAGEKGEVNLKLAVFVESVTKTDVGDAPEHQIGFFQLKAIAFNMGGGPFLDAAVAGRVLIDYTAGVGTNKGYWVFTDPDGDKLVALRIGEITSAGKGGLDKPGPGREGKATFEFLSGTGKYAGIKGSGDSPESYVGPGLLVINFKGQYELH